MTGLTTQLLWCALQATLIAAVGVSLSLALAHRFPRLAGAASASAAAMVLAATLTVALPAPRWTVPDLAVGGQATAGRDGAEHAPASADSPSLGAAAAMADLRTALSWLGRVVGQQQQRVAGRPGLAAWVAGALAAGAALGLARLAASLWMAARLRRHCSPIHDPTANDELRRLEQAMACTTAVQLKSSAHLPGAAVMGVFSPTIILPDAWRSWSSRQLRAVLAHESAHISRRDYTWRLLSHFSAAVHCYNPLVGWLQRRLAYSQELAADQLAAATLGSRSEYSKALSQLAILQDDAPRPRTGPVLLPTFSSNLIRRIKMVRARECVESGSAHRAARLALGLVVVLVGVGATALKGLADPTDASGKAAPPAATSADAQSFHARTPSLPLIDSENEQGVFHLRVAELLRLQRVQACLPLVDRAVDQLWKQAFGATVSPSLHLESIESISGMAFLGVKPTPGGGASDFSHRVIWGTGYAFVRFNREVSNWEQWVQSHIPGAEPLALESGTYLRLPVVPALGPAPVYVAAYDERTLIVALGEELVDGLRSSQLRAGDARWEADWRRLDTGLFSLLSSDKKIEVDPNIDETGTPQQRAFCRIFQDSDRIGVSLDWNDASGLTGIKYQLCCSSPAVAENLAQEIEQLRGLLLAESKGKLQELAVSAAAGDTPAAEQKASDATREQCLQTIQLCETCQVQTLVGGGEAVIVEVRTAVALPLVQAVREMTPGPEEVAQSTDATVTK